MTPTPLHWRNGEPCITERDWRRLPPDGKDTKAGKKVVVYFDEAGRQTFLQVRVIPQRDVLKGVS